MPRVEIYGQSDESVAIGLKSDSVIVQPDAQNNYLYELTQAQVDDYFAAELIDVSSDGENIQVRFPFIPVDPVYSVPVLQGFRDVLTDSNGTVIWIDATPHPDRDYRVLIDGSEQGVTSALSLKLTAVPVDGQSHDLELQYRDSDTDQYVSAGQVTFTAASPTATAGNETADKIAAFTPQVFTLTPDTTVFNTPQLWSAINSASSGDVILMHESGAFEGLPGAITRSFTDGNPLRIVNEAEPMTPASSGHGSFYPWSFGSGAANIDLINIQINGQDTANECVTIGGFNQVWGGAARNINIYGGRLQGAYFKNIGIDEGSHDVYVEDVDIDRSGYGAPLDEAGAGEGAYLGSGTGSPNSFSYNVKFKGCRFSRSRAEWVDIKTASYNVEFELCTFEDAQIHSQGGITIGINSNAPEPYNVNVTFRDCMARGVYRKASGGPHYDGHVFTIGHGNVLIDGLVAFDCPFDDLIAGYSQSNGPNDTVTITNSVLCSADGKQAINLLRQDTDSNERLTLVESGNLIDPDTATLTARFNGPFTGDQDTWTLDDFKEAADNPAVSVTIVEDGQTLTDSTASISIQIVGGSPDDRYDVWWTNDLNADLNDITQWNDPYTSVKFPGNTGTFTTLTGIPQDGLSKLFQVRRLAAGSGEFVTAALATLTAATIVSGGGNILISSYSYTAPNNGIRLQYGCSGQNYGAYTPPTIPSGVDYSPTSRSQAQSMIDSMNPGQVLKLPNNANDWSLTLNGSSGSSTLKKMIVGESDCFGSGPRTSTRLNLTIPGDNWMLANMEIDSSSRGFGRMSTISGSHNVFFNMRNVNNTLFIYDPEGSYGNPGTVGNKFVRIYNQGPGHSDSNTGLEFRSNSNSRTGATSQDTLIAGCVFKDYGATGATAGSGGSGKAMTDNGWFWAEEWVVGGGTRPGPPPQIYVEVVGCHFIDCLDETITCKNNNYWIHENLFESDNSGHISFRSTSESHAHSNVILSNSNSGIRNAGGTDNSAYFNVVYLNNNAGFGIAHAALQEERNSPFSNSQRVARGQQARGKFKYNFWFGPGSSDGYLRYLFNARSVFTQPTEDNDFRNFYIGPPKGLDAYDTSSSDRYLDEAGAEATQAGFEARNPLATLNRQYWGTRTSGNNISLPSQISIPSEINTGYTWIDGRPIIAKPITSILGPSGAVLKTNQ